MNSNKTDLSGTPVVNSVIHATQILELYAAQREEYLSITEISKALQMHKTTVYRILRTLQSVGWIEQSMYNGKYKLGTGILLVSSAVSVHLTSRGLIAEEMRNLLEIFNETVVLSALRSYTGICVDMVKSKHSLSVNSENGYIVPLNKGATGKTLLAAQPDMVIDKILFDFPEVEREVLRKQIRQIQSEGYCVSEGEVDLGVAAVAVPLRLDDGIYTLSISGPVDRLRNIGYTNILHSLREAANNIQIKTKGMQ